MHPWVSPNPANAASTCWFLHGPAFRVGAHRRSVSLHALHAGSLIHQAALMQHMAHARCRECRCLWLTCDNSHLATQVNILGWTAGEAGGKARQMATTEGDTCCMSNAVLHRHSASHSCTACCMPEQPKQNKREGGVSHLNLMKDLGCTQLSNVLSTPNP